MPSSPFRSLGLASILLAAALLSGCGTKVDPGTSNSTMTSGGPAPPFDGQAALGYVRGLALQSDGSPRFRIPGTAGQAEGAAYLWAQMDVPGWSRHWQNFTGADYVALDRSTVASYVVPGTSVCSKADSDRVPGFPFHNLIAIHSSGKAGAPLLLIGAHWDSQMNSNYDPDPAKRHLPDPGANDGASGVGLLVELMHELKDSHLTFDVGIVMLDGEDGFYNCYPLAGSLYLAQHPVQKVGRFLLLDMVGDAHAKFVRESSSLSSDRAFVDLIWRSGWSHGGWAAFTNTTTSIQDDHVAFIQAGVPSVDLIDAGWPNTFPPQWDTSFDTVEKVSPVMLALVGDTLLTTLADPALAAAWPSR